jgi:hypothetical protein
LLIDRPADDPAADLRQPLAQRDHRLLLDLVGHGLGAQDAAEDVGQRV